MATSRPTAEQRPAEQHQAAQAALAATAAVGVGTAWVQFFDLSDLTKTGRRLAEAIYAIANQYGKASASAALTDYRNQRRAAGASGPIPRLHMPTPVTREDATLSVQHVLTPLYGNPSPEQVTAAEQSLESSVERLVLDQSRRALIDAVRSDREAKGWARVTEPEACYFCAVLAARAVYRTKKTANFRAHTKQPNGSGGTCRCHVEPFFTKYEPTAQARQWQADWNRLKAENGGKLSLLQWRRAYEGRDGTGRDPLDGQVGTPKRNNSHRAGHSPKTQADGGNGKKPPPQQKGTRGPDGPDEYPETNTGTAPPFTPSTRPHISQGSRNHILQRHGRDGSGETRFPWADAQIMVAVDATLARPDSVEHWGDQFVFLREIDGETVHVSVRTDKPRPFIWTAYPLPKA